MATAKKQLNNLHLILASFSVKTPKQKIMNVVAYVECGEDSKIQFTIKNHRSPYDPIYAEKNANDETIYLSNVDISIDDISSMQIMPYKLPLIFSYSNKLLCKTAAEIHFYTFPEICLDHVERPLKNYLHKELEAEIAKGSSESEIRKLFDTPCSQVVVSNIIPLKKINLIGDFVTHADLYFSHLIDPNSCHLSYPDFSQCVPKELKPFNKHVDFGNDVYIVSTKPKISEAIFGDILFNYYQEELTTLKFWEKRALTIQSNLNKYFIKPVVNPLKQQIEAEELKDNTEDRLNLDKQLENCSQKNCFKENAEQHSALKSSPAIEEKPYFVNWLNTILSSMTQYAKSVVLECPSYFPKKAVAFTNSSAESYSLINFHSANLVSTIGPTVLPAFEPCSFDLSFSAATECLLA